MAMFALAVGTAFLSMAFMPTSGPAFASLDQPAKIAEEASTTGKTSRLPLSETDLACRGQAWGAESDQCLVEIARSAGIGERKVRKLAAADSSGSMPNMF